MIRKNRGKNKGERWIKQMSGLKKRYTIAIDEFLEISKETIEYKSKNIRYLDELEKELENIYETLIGDTKKKEAFRKNLLDWVKKYVEYLKNEKKKVI